MHDNFILQAQAANRHALFTPCCNANGGGGAQAAHLIQDTARAVGGKALQRLGNGKEEDQRGGFGSLADRHRADRGDGHQQVDGDLAVDPQAGQGAAGDGKTRDRQRHNLHGAGCAPLHCWKKHGEQKR
jgi:hypothetical protein